MFISSAKQNMFFGAQGENRTLMMLPSIDFESIASTNSATWACPNNTLIAGGNQFIIHYACIISYMRYTI
ncbi:MAG: hypothetical protein UW01_C0001G0092 [Candidatus Nomurabacteria bacterium GW2011_GWA2_43_66]|uniref:Uncharacterized protein n=1 Tax=Candidatus Nomurabacteria bacterium GW2011_GWF2_43_24 TaxID=1618778 RepID=A0A0G1HLW1_9BACT|nr:MAG: hypothetical protein UV13_C0001G0091 [Parcubacteria group bacterium GW2011_GWC1_42_21]KKT00690.1 MAG: hypothetical protein UV77_C0001G0061 [Candidatus Nomurabacteria bacterium GW2011_GWA1_43_17]KKT07888.1 MAG: hypothetical protein UV85_C0003G0013 [Candidatus Nomurabacteria bacterium GW2011_GWB1_43_19]KKT11849.1 MAG: hypothetical protein UV91_C0001G0061 [Candidatus Nomurabacteria bacterium GW2011_GWF2_43_24]KKT18398.1 MAG: hypothetical protein UW01_C0001G0092 [Candidatus Nomurabacteria b